MPHSFDEKRILIFIILLLVIFISICAKAFYYDLKWHKGHDIIFGRKKEAESNLRRTLNLEKSKRELKKIMDGMEDNMNGEMDPNMHDPDEAHGSSHFLAFNKVLPIQGFIFEKWNIKNTGDVAWTCVVIGLLAFLVEFIKFGKIKISRKFKTKKWLRAGTISLLHFLQVTFSYVLMLAVMTFHPGIFFAACVGLTVGFFVFRALCSSNFTTDEDCCE